MSVAATYSADGSCYFVFCWGFFVIIISRLQHIKTFELALAKSQGLKESTANDDVK